MKSKTWLITAGSFSLLFSFVYSPSNPEVSRPCPEQERWLNGEGACPICLIIWVRSREPTLEEANWMPKVTLWHPHTSGTYTPTVIYIIPSSSKVLKRLSMITWFYEALFLFGRMKSISSINHPLTYLYARYPKAIWEDTMLKTATRKFRRVWVQRQGLNSSLFAVWLFLV